jgi:hypothetical protein
MEAKKKPSIYGSSVAQFHVGKISSTRPKLFGTCCNLFP